VSDSSTSRSAEDWLADFTSHLRDACGMLPSTQGLYVRRVRNFLESRYPHGTSCHLGELTPADIRDYVRQEAHKGTPTRLKNYTTAVRAFLRYLVIRGVCDASLVAAFPRIPTAHQANVPKGLSETQVQALLRSFDRHTGTGRRDYAVVQCLVRLGLRAGEVTALCLEDLDWDSRSLRLHTNKERRPTVLPLPDEVAAAIRAYLHNGRPSGAGRHLFVQHRNEHAALSKDMVRYIVARGWRHSGITMPSPRRTHVLRHTLATQLLNKGVDLKRVADILRHRKLETTLVYAHVDWTHLTEVVQPWPVTLP